MQKCEWYVTPIWLWCERKKESLRQQPPATPKCGWSCLFFVLLFFKAENVDLVLYVDQDHYKHDRAD